MKKFTFSFVALLVVGFALFGFKAPTEQAIGALSGPDIASPYISVGGLAEYSSRSALNTATTTPCAVQSPSSTSTLTYTGVMITTGTTTDATTWTAATSSTAFATTSPIVPAFTLAAATQGQFMAATSSPSATNNGATGSIMGPNKWVVWSISGTTPGSRANLNGFCSAKFRVF